MIAIKYGGRQYWAHWAASGDVAHKDKWFVGVGVAFLQPVHRRRHVVMPDEESARRWLSDNGLRKSKAKKLLAAALRNEGDYADPSHPHRVIEHTNFVSRESEADSRRCGPRVLS